ncbi:hypothetical protein AYI70_g10145, partial [Smittium culicis]
MYGLPLLSEEPEEADPPAGGFLDPDEDPGEEFDGGLEFEPGIGFWGVLGG